MMRAPAVRAILIISTPIEFLPAPVTRSVLPWNVTPSVDAALSHCMYVPVRTLLRRHPVAGSLVWMVGIVGIGGERSAQKESREERPGVVAGADSASMSWDSALELLELDPRDPYVSSVLLMAGSGSFSTSCAPNACRGTSEYSIWPFSRTLTIGAMETDVFLTTGASFTLMETRS